MKAKLFMILSLAGILGANAQEPLVASKCFSEAPPSVISFLDKNTRLDMLDYFRAGSDRASSNIYGGNSRILSEDEQSITFLGTDNMECQIFVLNPDGAGGLVAIGYIETIPTPIPDSKFTLYDSRWNVLADRFSEPMLKDWLINGGSKNAAAVADAIPFIMASYSYESSSQTLTVTNTTSQYFHPSDTPEALSLLNTQLQYKWDGKNFKLIKK